MTMTRRDPLGAVGLAAGSAARYHAMATPGHVQASRGVVPSVINDAAEPNAPDAFGATQAQTVSVLWSTEATLSDLDLPMGDILKMQAFLVARDGADGMVFAGFMAGYTQFFGTETQPHLPVRSMFEVAGLANPAWLVEIEVTSVRPAPL